MARHHRTDIRESAVRSRYDPGPATAPSLHNGCGPSPRAVHHEPCPATRTHRPCRSLTPRCAGRGPSAGAAEYRRVAGMAGLGAKAGGRRKYNRPGFRSGGRTPESVGPWGFIELSQPLESIMESACGFTSGLPVAALTQCLHRPVTSERAIRAGPIADMLCICNNGRGGAVDGRQPSLPGHSHRQ